ncbi:MAG TPA: hypothetical protein VKM55_27325 [Candidatus Lokiarchaeia archaeon]|nr:hypothetical protein [Candidatus Lokiarchaeia archaeon]
MFGADFNADEMREKLGSIKEKVEITKEDDGVVLVFTDPEMLNDPSTGAFFSPSNFENLKGMVPGGENLAYKVEPVTGGVKFITDDPDAFYDLLQKIFDPDFLMNIVEQLLSAFAGPGGILDSLGELGNEMEKMGDGLNELGNEIEKLDEDESGKPEGADQENTDEDQG